MSLIHRVSSALLAAFGLLAAAAAPAATINVNIYQDGSHPSWCSLRDAIKAANTNASAGGCGAGSASPTVDLINVPPGVYHLQAGTGSTYWNENANATGDLDISSNLILRGTDARRTIILGMDRDRVIDIHNAGTQVSIEHLTLVGGDLTQNGSSADKRGGTMRILSNATTGVQLQLRNAILRDGRAEQGGNLYASVGDPSTGLRLQNVSVLDGYALHSGGGLYLASGTIADPERIVLENTTISGNRGGSAYFGGGAAIDGRVRMNHVTVTGNSPNGLFVRNDSFFKRPRISNSVIWGNYHGSTMSGVACTNWSDSVAFLYHSVNSYNNAPGECAAFQSVGWVNTDPKLSPRFDFGAGLFTHALLFGSTAIGHGKPGTSGDGDNCLATDARGVARPGQGCDAGAYQARYDMLVNSVFDLPDANPGNGTCAAINGQCTLRAAVMEASANGGRWIVRLPPGTYLLDRGTVEGNDPTGGDLDVAPEEGNPPLSLALIGQGDPGEVNIVGNADRVLETRTELSDDEPWERVPLAFALINATVRGGRLSKDLFSDNLSGGGIRIESGRNLFYNVVLADNEIASGHTAALYARLSPELVRQPGSTGATFVPYSSSLHMERFALVDNHATGGGSGAATIGIYTPNSAFRNEPSILRNGTIAGNTFADGTALSVSGQDMNLSYLTIADNHALSTSAALAAGLQIGASAGGAPASVVQTSVIAGNTAAGQPWDCRFDPAVLALGYLAVGNDHECDIAGDPTGNQINVNPQLAPLSFIDTGMAAMLPQATSPLRDAIPSNHCLDAQGRFNPHDAVGDARPQTGGCSIGAIEQLSAPKPADQIFADGFESSP